MIAQPSGYERAIRLLVYVGGVASTIVGSWLSSKIHTFHDNRKSHLEDIKTNVLIPFRKELGQFKELLFHRTPLFSVNYGTKEYRQGARVTEPCVAEGVLLCPAIPAGPLFSGTEPALAEDARRNHYRELTGQLNKFVENWAAYSGNCQFWINQVAKQVLERSELPEFPNTDPELGIPAPYVMHFELAIFIYKRLFGLPAPALRIEQLGDTGMEVITGENTSLAVGGGTQLGALLDQLDGLLTSQKINADKLLNQAVSLEMEFTQITRSLNLAIAARRLRKPCDLVTFF